MADQVECHSEYEYAQRPVAFTWQGVRLPVERILDEARTPQGKRFLVQAGDGQEFYLSYAENQDEWTVRTKTDWNNSTIEQDREGKTSNATSMDQANGLLPTKEPSKQERLN